MTNIVASLPVNGPGQHAAVVMLPAGSPPLYVGNRRWLRKHMELGQNALYFAEYWGEGVPADGQADMAPSTTDLRFEMDPDVATIDLTHPSLTINGANLDYLNSGNSFTPAALAVRHTLSSDLWSAAKLSMLVLPRHPVVYCTLQLKMNAQAILLPDYSPITAKVSLPMAHDVTVTGQIHGCNCQMDFKVSPARVTPDPSGERDRALANAQATPRYATAVDVR